MKTTAIICVLNPIHFGHKCVFDAARSENDVTIAVMSGNFTQRAIPAVYEKYTRAEAALRCGADLVFELPFPWSTSGVEDFACGGVTVASSCGAESLTFGSETADLSLLNRLAEIKSSDNYAASAKETER